LKNPAFHVSSSNEEPYDVSKEHRSKKEGKKKASKSLTEKRAEKKAKKQARMSGG
jgi:hypothetical protein